MRRLVASAAASSLGLRSQAPGAAGARALGTNLGLSDPDLLRTRSYVGGQWIDAQSGETIEVTPPAPPPPPQYAAPHSPLLPTYSSIPNCLLLQVVDPATGKPIARVPNCGGAETRLAIAAAETQFKEWGRRPGKERATILRRWACAEPGQASAQAARKRPGREQAIEGVPPLPPAPGCRWFDLVVAARDDICRLMTAESGEPAFLRAFAWGQGSRADRGRGAATASCCLPRLQCRQAAGGVAGRV